MLKFDQQIKAMQAQLKNLFRVGTVTSIKPDLCRARVVFPDRDNMESADLQIIVRNTLKDKDYWMPDIGEQVLCFFLPIGLEQGFIIGSYYINDNPPPAVSENKQTVEFEDGTKVEYDREAHKLQIDVTEGSGQVVINCAGSVTVNSPKIDLGEDSSLEPSVLGDSIATALDSLRNEINNAQVIGNLGAPTSPILAVKPMEFIDLLSGGASYSTKNRNQ